MEETVKPLGIKPEPTHRRRVSSDSKPGSIGSGTTPSPSSTTSNQTPGPSTQSSIVPDDRGILLEEDDVPTTKENGTAEDDDPIDRDSMKGIFGWDTVDDTSIPYLLRRGRKFVSVRIVECKLLSKYPNTIPEELAKKDPLVSHFITEAEANLLNEINMTHCDYEYGQNSFSAKDLIVDLEEFLVFFKIVKKNFPEDILASMNAEVQAPDTMPETPPATEPSQYCGWVQINNTVSPYIVRSDGKEQVKLVPLSVIVYAAGLLTGCNVEGLLPTIEECTMLNSACKTAGFDFTFGRNTRLIAITEVVQRCQVQIYELPISNPLQHAHYLDNRYGQPTPPSILTSSIRQPPPYPGHMAHYPNPMGVDNQPGAMSQNSNPFARRYSVPRLPSTPAHMPGMSGPPNVTVSRLPSPPNPSNSKSMTALMHQTMPDKNLRNFDSMSSLAKMMAGNSHYPAMWPMPGRAPPAHKPVKAQPPSHPPLPPSTSSSSTYQPMSLPPSPLLHTSLAPPNINTPVYRNSGPLPRKDTRYPNMMGNKPALPPPPQSQYSTLPNPSFGVNQFNSSLFARTESSSEAHKPRPSISSPSPSSSTFPSYHQNRCNVPNSSLSQMLNSSPKPRNTQNSVLAKNISACLVNGKSISCLNVDNQSRSGKLCLVEAVSKLYFPTIPIWEFVKVLQDVLMANLYECTLEEEAAFVQYYNLPVPKLKCNQMIMVSDLQRYFPQLNYVFSKRLSEQSASGSADTVDGGLKRQHSSSPSGPPAKQGNPRLENVVQKLHQDRRPSSSNHEGPSNGGVSSSIIVIDD